MAIDSLALLWRQPPFAASVDEQFFQENNENKQKLEQQQQSLPYHQQVFLEELDGADVHYRQALAEPLLRAIHEKAGPILGARPQV